MPRKPPPEATRWKEGQSGNPAGRPKTKTLSEYAREQLAEIVDETTGKTRGQQIVESWLANCIVTPALMLSLLDRTEGKVTDKLDVTSAGKSLADLLIALKRPNGSSD